MKMELEYYRTWHLCEHRLINLLILFTQIITHKQIQLLINNCNTNSLTSSVVVEGRDVSKLYQAKIQLQNKADQTIFSLHQVLVLVQLYRCTLEI